MLERTLRGDILEIRLARPPVNAMNPELLAALREAIAVAPGEGARGLVISGGPSVFSAGLDVPRLIEMDRGELEAAWREFFGVLETLARSPLPSNPSQVPTRASWPAPMSSDGSRTARLQQ